MKAVLLDTNLLVLLIIGAVERRWIARHKRTKAFVAADWDLLCGAIAEAPVLTTPHVLAEASNLLRLGGMTAAAHAELMARLALFIAAAREEHVPARNVSTGNLFLRLGLTDAAIHSMARPDVHLLTVDLDLYLAALGRGQPATNFNHLRDRAG